MSEVVMDEVAPAPRTVTIERRWAIGGVVATALIMAALAVALILSVVDDGRDGGPDAFAPAAFGTPMSPGEFPEGGPGAPPMGSGPESMPLPPEGMMPPGAVPKSSGQPDSPGGGPGSSGSGSGSGT